MQHSRAYVFRAWHPILRPSGSVSALAPLSRMRGGWPVRAWVLPHSMYAPSLPLWSEGKLEERILNGWRPILRSRVSILSLVILSHCVIPRRGRWRPLDEDLGSPVGRVFGQDPDCGVCGQQQGRIPVDLYWSLITQR